MSYFLSSNPFHIFYGYLILRLFNFVPQIRSTSHIVPTRIRRPIRAVATAHNYLKPERMAVIINTAMEAVGCAAYKVFSTVKFVEILRYVRRMFVLKCVFWMHYVPIVVIDCYVYELVCREVDKSWTKLTQKVDMFGFPFQLTCHTVSV